MLPNPQNSGRDGFKKSTASFILLLVGIALTPIDQILGTHIVIVSLIIITKLMVE